MPFRRSAAAPCAAGTGLRTPRCRLRPRPGAALRQSGQRAGRAFRCPPRRAQRRRHSRRRRRQRTVVPSFSSAGMRLRGSQHDADAGGDGAAQRLRSVGAEHQFARQARRLERRQGDAVTEAPILVARQAESELRDRASWSCRAPRPTLRSNRWRAEPAGSSGTSATTMIELVLLEILQQPPLAGALHREAQVRPARPASTPACRRAPRPCNRCARRCARAAPSAFGLAICTM